MKINITDESAMQDLGGALAQACESSTRIYLEGNLGAGKTTLARGFLRGLGYTGSVKSPTYGLIESYNIDSRVINHLDLYRLSDPEELEFIGLRDLLDDDAILLVEWPEQGRGILPEPDLAIEIQHTPNGRSVDLQAHTEQGNTILSSLKL